LGVVLSGILDDGCHGLLQIKRAHGITIVQDPDEATQSSMPQNAVERVGVDYILPSAEIGELITELVHRKVEFSVIHPTSHVDVAEGIVDALRMENFKVPPAPLVCPDCGGSLWEVADDAMLRYRCHVGHGYTADTLASLQATEAEQLLWSAVRVLEEQAELQRRLAAQWESKTNFSLRERFAANAEERQRSADLLRTIVTAAPRLIEQPQDDLQLRSEYGS
jgi:two-component system, chemotaxis family, protein-glutamate methylesterase/glutaminase